LTQTLSRITASLADVGQHHAELDRRASRLREWLDVQSALSSARTDVDRMVSYVLEALNMWKTGDLAQVNTDRVRAKLESTADKWRDDCSEDLNQLRELLEGCAFITQADPGDATQPARASAAGWVADLDKVYQESQVFGQDVAGLQDDSLRPTCIELDNRGRRLRDWLRDHDNECRTSLKGESAALATLADRLKQWARANEGD
jgi:hypothetical protein